MMRRLWMIGYLLLISVVGCATNPSDGLPKLTEEQARADIKQILEIVSTTHPDLAFSANRKELQQASEAIKRSIKGPMSPIELWRVASKLNPLFKDAHVGVRYPVAQFDDYKSSGGEVFSIPVFVDRDGRIRVSETIGAAAVLAPDDEILLINGIATTEVVEELSTRMRGETISLQRFIMGFNFPAYFWALYGGYDRYSVVVRTTSGDRKRIKLPSDAPKEDLHESVFRHRIVGKNTGYLRIKSFHRSLEQRFSAFLASAFEEFDSANIGKLIIDIRDNPGGAHDVSDLLVAYLTDAPITPASELRARVTDDNLDLIPASSVGDVVTIPFEERIDTKSDRLPFDGAVFVLVSADTYSQAIVFAVTLQDYGMAQIVGEETGGNANQTGQVKMTPLRHSGLLVAAPLYVIYRPSGARTAGGVRPDIPLPHNRRDPDAMIEALLSIPY